MASWWQDLAGTLTVPRTTERLLAEVHATGSGGGCEEFWYLTAPAATGYSCPADPGPYREVQVLLGVPRDQRQAVGISEERYRQGRYDRTITTVNGFVI